MKTKPKTNKVGTPEPTGIYSESFYDILSWIITDANDKELLKIAEFITMEQNFRERNGGP